MKNVFNREEEPWIRPWNQEKFDDLYNRDERFFAVVLKGMLSWLNRNIVMYNKQINHFIFNTGSSYLYIESNGYEYNLSETTGEDTIYMQLPRCIIELSNIHIPTEELTSPFSRGYYERRDGDLIRGYNSEIRRLPLEVNVRLQYYLGTFNESLILMQELIDKLVFQQYFNITYLGNIIQCSIEFPPDTETQINKIDMMSADPNQRTIELALIINTSYPLINERAEIPTDKVIEKFGYEVDLYLHNHNSDVVAKGNVISEDDGFSEFEEDLVNEKEGYIFNEVNNGEPPYHIIGNNEEDDISGHWTGEHMKISKYEDGLTVIFTPNVIGNDNGITLNINKLGDRNIYIDDELLTNQIETNKPISLIYNRGDEPIGRWIVTEDFIENQNNGKVDISNTNDKFIKGFDMNEDDIVELDDLIKKYDINGDGVIDEVELADLLNKIKYELYDEDVDYTEQCHYRIDYKDLYYAIKLVNKQTTVSAHYDKFTRKIYVTHNDTGQTAELDMIKYKIIKDK